MQPVGAVTAVVAQVSVVIPTLNEVATLAPMLQDLAAQQGIALEVVIADGGSDDATLDVARDCAARLGLELRGVRAPRGRGRQMNAGARAAQASELLFLHADTRIDDPTLLARSLAHLCDARRTGPMTRIAGHYGLHFLRSDDAHAAAYFYYSSKTHLNRADCINGDQGLWLTRAMFDALGGFDDSLPFMEDARIARRVFADGAWTTLPGVLSTSARRFETEGLRARQTLNAMLRVFDHLGRNDFLTAASHAYRQQRHTSRLVLRPFFDLALQHAAAGAVMQRVRFWYGAGGYMAANAWQLAFALDCRAARRRGLAPGSHATPWLGRYDRWCASLLTRAPCRAVAGLLLWMGMHGARVVLR